MKGKLTVVALISVMALGGDGMQGVQTRHTVKQPVKDGNPPPEEPWNPDTCIPYCHAEEVAK